jgi:hypothetical protein
VSSLRQRVRKAGSAFRRWPTSPTGYLAHRRSCRPGISEMLLAGRECEFLGQFAFPAMSATPGAIKNTDIDEFVRTYFRPDGWRGAIGLYQSMLQEGDEIATLLAGYKLNIPVLAIGTGGGEFTFATMSRSAPTAPRSGQRIRSNMDLRPHHSSLVHKKGISAQP